MPRKPSILNENDFEVKASSVEGIGLGLFARRTIYRGDTIGPYTGKILTDKQTNSKPYVYSHYLLWVCHDCHIMAEGPESSYTRYINHSNRPNSRFVVSTRWKKARVEALRRIRTGEEIFIDYGPYFWEMSETPKIDSP